MSPISIDSSGKTLGDILEEALRRAGAPSSNPCDPFSTKNMTILTDKKQIQTEASSLGLLPEFWPTTITLTSHRTGNKETWRFLNKQMSGDQTEAAIYVPGGDSLTLRDWCLIVFNT